MEPEIIAGDPELHEIWLKTVEAAHAGYCALAEKLNDKLVNVEDKTSRRKQARQAARSVLPNATETKIFVTANARALRHFIEMRGSRHADDEIRALAIAILKVMQEEAPNIFGDYVLIEYEPGKFEVATKYNKV